MPIEILKKEKFEKGLITYQDSRDLDESSLANATNVMCDLLGKVRQMGKEQVHTNAPQALLGSLTPGYGIFAFNADYDVTNNSVSPTRLIAYQNGNNVNIYDSTENANEFSLGGGTLPAKPVFYYIDGNLRTSDANFNNTSHSYVRTYGFISKTWFSGETHSELIHTADWNQGSLGGGLDAYIYPPTNSESASGNLRSDEDFASHIDSLAGHIGLEISVEDSGNGEWIADGETSYKFGVNFIYDGDQESPITNFTDIFNPDAAGYSDDFVLKIKPSVIVHNTPTAFDPRIKGYKLWLTGDSSGDFDDPLYLAYYFFGDSSTDLAYVESHRGDKQTVFSEIDAGGGVERIVPSSFLEIPTMPALTYALLNPGQSHQSKTTASKFKASIIANRRIYIGGIERIGFDISSINTGSQQSAYRQPALITSYDINADRMLRSPVNRFDIFPNENIIDVAVNDGESITALEIFADRIFQFKERTLYIINISSDYEYLEAEHKYKGISEPYQVIKTEYGIAWVNKNGCYLYTEKEGLTNLIDGKLDLVKPKPSNVEGLDLDDVEGWQAFVGESAMLGYIPDLKQLVVFQGPHNAYGSGNVMVYDLRTGSWSRGIDAVSPTYKSNIITNYGDNCLYLSISEDIAEQHTALVHTIGDVGAPALWILNNVQTTSNSFTNAKLTINGVDITDSFNYTATDPQPLIERIREEIIAKTGNIFSFNATGDNFHIVLRADSSDWSTYAGGELAWVGGPTAIAETTIIATPSFSTNTTIAISADSESDNGLYHSILVSFETVEGSPDAEFIARLISPSNSSFDQISYAVEADEPQMWLDSGNIKVDLFDTNYAQWGSQPLGGGGSDSNQGIIINYAKVDNEFIKEDGYPGTGSDLAEQVVTGLVRFPAVNFLKYGSLYVITMLGDYTDVMFTGVSFTVSGLGTEGSGATLETTLSNSPLIFQSISFVDGTTICTAIKGLQSDATQTYWDSLISYASEIETTPSITFTPASGGVFTIGAKSEGTQATAQKIGIYPNRKYENTGVFPGDIIYSASILDHLGKPHYIEHATVASDTAFDIAVAIESEVSALRGSYTESATDLWADEKLQTYTGLAVTDIDTTTFTVDKDLPSIGVFREEMVIKVADTTTFYYKVASYSVVEDVSTTIVIKDDQDDTLIKNDTGDLTGNNIAITEGAVSLLSQVSNTSLAQIQANAWVAGELDVKEFNNTVADGTSVESKASIRVETPEYTFDAPGVEKLFYKVSITAKAKDVFSVKAAFNGSNYFESLLFEGNNPTQFVGSTNDWQVSEWYVSTDRVPVGMDSVKIRIESNSNMHGFELNDVTIFYRRKGIR